MTTGPQRTTALALIVVVVSSLAALTPRESVLGQAAGQVFPQTGHSVRGAFLAYWQQHGGLAQQGYPLSEEVTEVSPVDGKSRTVQYFERAVFELHPENAWPYNVLLSRLGSNRFTGRYPKGAPGEQASTDNPRRFPETGAALGGRFRQYWETHGGLAQQGYPVSDEFKERSEVDGQIRTVQYFERAVFEYHPENPPPYDVLLTLVGKFHLRIAQAKAAAARLPNTPRIYAQGPSAIDEWPDDGGTSYVHYNTCGVQPLAVSFQDVCNPLMALTTEVSAVGPNINVAFVASWQDGDRRYRWGLLVTPDGKATLTVYGGDPLPVLPQ
ncbi:MAG TPA: hypothetical protein VM536_13320 [Chloroflexia bacterium]|nr:hypothetical protein [Chloroflexia bacterium]